MVAGQGGLVKDGLVATDEAPVGSLDNLTSVIFNGQADMEDFGAAAVVLHSFFDDRGLHL